MAMKQKDWNFWIKRGLFFALIAFLLLQAQYILRIIWFDFADPASSPYIRAEESRLADKNKVIRFQWVDYKNISSWMPKAVIAAEDQRFMEHSGVEWEAIKKAFVRNVIEDEFSPGGSTLTQQTVKNLFLSHERSYLRKAEEIFLAKVMELFWSKERILEVYLNIAEFGNGIFGVQAAAQHYFKKNASRLNRSECEWLAAILINPKRYENRKTTNFLKKRLNRIHRDIGAVGIP